MKRVPALVSTLFGVDAVFSKVEEDFPGGTGIII